MKKPVLETKWQVYAELQGKADSANLNDNAWAADAALETVLDQIEAAQSQAECDAIEHAAVHLLRNRLHRFSARRKSLDRHRAFMQRDQIQSDAHLRIAARQEFAIAKAAVAPVDFSILCHLGVGFTYAEIADQTGTNVNTVKARAMRARRKLSFI